MAMIIAIATLYKNRNYLENYSRLALSTEIVKIAINISVHDYSEPMQLYINETVILFTILAIISIGSSLYSIYYKRKIEEIK